MAVFITTIKEDRWTNGVQLEKGMSVQFVSNYSTPLSTNGGIEVIEAFMRKYCVDIKKANAVSDAWISIKKINF
jgi:hypothetical protein